MEKRFIINEEKRTVVCLYETSVGLFKGKAKCSENDEWNENLGKDIASIRADMKYVIKRNKDLINLRGVLYRKQIEEINKLSVKLNKITSKVNSYADLYLDLKEELFQLLP